MKIFKIGNVRPILHSWFKGDITISRAAEMFNEAASRHVNSELSKKQEAVEAMELKIKALEDRIEQLEVDLEMTGAGF